MKNLRQIGRGQTKGWIGPDTLAFELPIFPPISHHSLWAC
jgi:hypothetical protein